MEEGAKTMT